MPFLEKIYTALLASSQSDSGTDDTLVGILNQDGIDVVHVDLGMGPDTGACILCPATIIESQVEPRNHYLRIGIRGDDAFLARVIAAWGVREGTSAVVPLGYDEEIEQPLSTDSSEGRISMPLRPAAIGDRGVRTEVNRVLLITGTIGPDAGTDSDVHVKVTTSSGTVVVDHTIPDTSQPDFEQAQANLYFLPVETTFTRSQLGDSSIELSILGSDLWTPVVVVMFGLDTEGGNPNAMIPLVHVDGWPVGGPQPPLSTDPDEGVPSIMIPLCPLDP